MKVNWASRSIYFVLAAFVRRQVIPLGCKMLYGLVSAIDATCGGKPALAGLALNGYMSATIGDRHDRPHSN
ncbi:hypothetical protein, partial [Mesorhizobium sanjuanii]|uniref:hypothetical protein n=1 Tax=Mesorhizobium sanjuanii TaxID=2037900 RepID=UPI001AD7E932